MHIPSVRVYYEMRSDEASLWYVPANGGEELAFLIKAPTSSIKALIAGCHMKLVFGRKDSYLCTAVRILDMPDAPILISRLQRESEEHSSLIRSLIERRFPVFLFNKMDICLAWTNIELTEEDSYRAINFLGQASQLYVGPFTQEASYALDCFCFSIDNTNMYSNARMIPTLEISTAFEEWRVVQNHFVGVRGYHSIAIDDKDEGAIFERAVWASLESVFPLTLHKNPKVKNGIKERELTDVFSFYNYGSFLIEAKDLSVLNAGYNRSQERRTAGVQKQVKKAISQLIGASRAFARGDVIFEANGMEFAVNRTQPPHCIILITELMNWGDWREIADQLYEAMIQTGAFFHLLDLRELITLLKGSSGNVELLDYNLIQRCRLCAEKRSVFIRSQPSFRAAIERSSMI